MGYIAAINKAWEGLFSLSPGPRLSLKFLAEEFNVKIQEREVVSLVNNAPAKDFSAILILHYLAQRLKGLPLLTGEWLTFREFSGIEGYYPAFKKRAIEPIIRKFGNNPEKISSVLEKLPAKKTEGADAAIIVDAFEGVPALIKVWKADAEFGPDANIYFDRSITDILHRGYCSFGRADRL